MKNAKSGDNRTRLLLLGFLIVVCIALIFVAFEFLDLGRKIELLSYTRISTADDLMSIKDDPDGKYILANDIDMTDRIWNPFSFNGILEGNGHAVNNLMITTAGSTEKTTYDGNMKDYETVFAGVFDVMEDAVVHDVSFNNISVDVSSDSPCFVGIVAGYMENSTISECTVSGTVSLYAHDRMFGIGGVIGYGSGTISDVETDVTLICVDTDKENKDEQFLGGICAAGYPDIVRCNVTLDAYDSDHGYVHNGGLIGLYQIYPEGTVYEGEMNGNHVSGTITFFEDNEDRRAYCEPFVGELMDSIPGYWDNTDDFVSNEVFEYDVDLLP